MRPLLAPLLILTGLAAGQVVSTPTISPAACTLNASGVPVSQPCSLVYTDGSMPIPTLWYGYGGAEMQVSMSAVNGLTYVTLYFVEPNKTGAGQRRFTVRVNDGLPIEIDVWKAAGLKKLLVVTLPPVIVTDQQVKVAIKGIVGNPMLSEMRVDAADINAVQVTQWLRCTGPTAPGADCTGLSYVLLRGKDGALTRLVATSVPDGLAFNPPNWTPVE